MRVLDGHVHEFQAGTTPKNRTAHSRALLYAAGLAAGIASTLALANELQPQAEHQQVLVGDNRGAQVRVEGNTLYYVGLITADGLSRFQQTLKTHPNVTTLQVRSRGGDALPAIDMGEIVLRRKLTVVVDRVCNSACASYLFTPASVRKVLPESMVIWHNSCPQNVPTDIAFERILTGDIHNLTGAMMRNGVQLSSAEIEVELQKQGPKLREKLRHYFHESARQQKKLFSKTGIDGRIDCLVDYLPLPPQNQAYTLSGADMAALGVCNVALPSDYEEGVKRLLTQEGLADRAGVVRLADYPEFKPAPKSACSAEVEQSD